MPPGMRKKFAEAKKAASAASSSPWVEVYDPENEAYYYWHSETQEVTWEAPEDYRMAADDATMAAAIKLQCVWRTKQAKKKVDGLPQNWVKVHDTEAGCDYYLNEMTGESAWELPEHLRAAEENGTLKEAELSAEATMEQAEKIRSIMRKAKMPPGIRKKFSILKRQRSMESESPWVEVYDPDMGKCSLCFFSYKYSYDCTVLITLENCSTVRTYEEMHLHLLFEKIAPIFFPAAFYYFHNTTGEVQWEAPADYRMAADDATMAAVIKIQCVYRSRRTKRRMGEILAGRGGARGAAKLKVEAAIAEHDAAAAASFAAQAETGGVWVEAFDPNSGKMYYFHTGTSENSWEKPDVYVMAADNVMVSDRFPFPFHRRRKFVFSEDL